jgi:hypothetical protein
MSIMLFQSLVFFLQAPAAQPKPAPTGSPAPPSAACGTATHASLSHGTLTGARPSLYTPTLLLLLSSDNIPTLHQPSYSPLLLTTQPHLPRLLFVPVRGLTPSSSTLVSLSRRRLLALSTWLTTERNQEMIICEDDDSRDPPGSWQYASKCLLISTKKMVPPSGFLTSGSHAIVNIVNKRENCITSD